MHCARRHDRHVIAADPAAVRALLETLQCGPALTSLTEDERDCTLLVLAEALNNVVEHAYGGTPGWIGLVPGPMRSGRDWRIVDRATSPPPMDCLKSEMPADAAEGGFGWPLIRALTEDVELRRRSGFNVLSLRIRADVLLQEGGPMAKHR